MKVVLINGSPREKGNTSILLNVVAKELEKEGIDAVQVQVGGKNIRGCAGCRQCTINKDRRCANHDDDLNEFLALMDEADGIVLGSPTYFADITSDMKSLIDRAGFVSRANGMMFRRKVGAAVIAMRRAGGIHAFDTLNHFFLIGEMIVPGSIYWNLGFGLQEGDVQQDSEALKTMQALGQNMAWVMKSLPARQETVAVKRRKSTNGNGHRKLARQR